MNSLLCMHFITTHSDTQSHTVQLCIAHYQFFLHHYAHLIQFNKFAFCEQILQTAFTVSDSSENSLVLQDETHFVKFELMIFPSKIQPEIQAVPNEFITSGKIHPRKHVF